MKMTFGERVFNCFNYIFLTIVGLSTTIPFIYVISSSVAPEKEILSGGMVLVPRSGLSLEAYHFILRAGSGIPRAYLVTLFVTLMGTALSLLVTASMGYGISRKNLPGGKAISYAVLFTMLFNGGLIPNYIIVRNVGLINSVWSLILPGLVSVWNMLVLISFFESIPGSIEESARMDGCNEIVIFFRIVIPLSLPALATISLFYAVTYWNQWFSAVIYINRKENWPLQLLLRQVLTVLDFNALNGTVDESSLKPPPSVSVKTATIVVTVLPILMTYPFIQKYFIKGVMIGAVKG